MMCSFDIIVINLDNSTGRLESVSSMLAMENVNWRCLSAVDGMGGMLVGDYVYDNSRRFQPQIRPKSCPPSA